jgi:hypothetical protein
VQWYLPVRLDYRAYWLPYSPIFSYLENYRMRPALGRQRLQLQLLLLLLHLTFRESREFQMLLASVASDRVL